MAVSNSHFFVLYILCYINITGASSDLLRSLSVPQYGFVGGSATLTCEFDLLEAQLYSLKWYHNGTEFYRFVPTERKGPINIRSTPKFVLHEVSRNSHKVTLNLSRLTPFSSGTYRCEIIAEHPSFRTEALSASMTVLREHLYPPVIDGAKPFYHPNDVIELVCRPLVRIWSGLPRPTLVWILNGRNVTWRELSDSSETEKEKKQKLDLRISAKKLLETKEQDEAQCRLVLGSHSETTTQLLRVLPQEIPVSLDTVSQGSRSSFKKPGFILFILVTQLIQEHL